MNFKVFTNFLNRVKMAAGTFITLHAFTRYRKRLRSGQKSGGEESKATKIRCKF